MFPIKPLFDKVIVREIPVEELFTEEDKKLMPFGHEQMKLRNRQGIVVAVGPDAEKHVSVEDRVYFEDTAMYEQVFVRPVDEFRGDQPKYWQFRVQDLKGVAVESKERLNPFNNENLQRTIEIFNRGVDGVLARNA